MEAVPWLIATKWKIFHCTTAANRQLISTRIIRVFGQLPSDTRPISSCAAGQLGTGFNHQLDIRVQGAQCVFLTGEIIISAFQRQRAILKLPAVAAVILGAALGANGVAVFIDLTSRVSLLRVTVPALAGGAVKVT